MAAIFLSDAHLKSGDDQGYRNLIGFLDGLVNGGPVISGNPAINADKGLSLTCIRDVHELYIVGDFFEFWFSRGRNIYPEFKPVIDRLVALKERGVHVCLCEGNHDFFLEDYFQNILKLTTSEEWLTLDLDGKRILVSHGDTVDQTNKPYQRYRKILRSGVVRQMKEWLPLPVLWGIARKCTEFSKAQSRESQDLLVEKMYRFALDKFHEGFDAVILGHCHVPALRETVIDGRTRTFATLGDWVDHYSYLYYANGRFEMCYYKS
ncbi:MAG: UDP-2,3-diacylglucosamine diphosphatase [Deltaproteobacteria bacterium]|nr:UDP-2,3-diacylglucosamine diphosphatase [Deltaproteobacteria bacterium]